MLTFAGFAIATFFGLALTGQLAMLVKALQLLVQSLIPVLREQRETDLATRAHAVQLQDAVNLLTRQTQDNYKAMHLQVDERLAAIDEAMRAHIARCDGRLSATEQKVESVLGVQDGTVRH